MTKVKILSSIIVSGAALMTGCAVTQGDSAIPDQLTILQNDLNQVNDKLEAIRVAQEQLAATCVWEGKRYTSGAVVNGQMCMVSTREDGKLAVWWNGTLESTRATKAAVVGE